jgi:hypothetical protein
MEIIITAKENNIDPTKKFTALVISKIISD